MRFQAYVWIQKVYLLTLFRHTDDLNRRISELNRNVQTQLQSLNDNIIRQEDAIRRSIKKSQESRSLNGRYSALSNISDSTKPPVPPPPKEYPAIQQIDNKPFKNVKINPSPNYLDKNGDASTSSFDEKIYKDERTIIIKKPKKKLHEIG